MFTMKEMWWFWIGNGSILTSVQLEDVFFKHFKIFWHTDFIS